MKKIEKIFEILREIYPDPKTELDYSTPFQLMMAVILSAQTTDKQVNKVTPAIFEYVKTSEDLLDGKRIRDNGKRGIRTKEYVFEEFERAISGVNYYKTKAKNIWKLAEILKKSSPLWLTNPSPKGSPSPLRGLCLYQGTQNQKKQNIEEQLGELMKLP
jgi:endonuclease-3